MSLRWIVTCPDGSNPFPSGFLTRAEATRWRTWEHIHAGDHSIRLTWVEVPGV